MDIEAIREAVEIAKRTLYLNPNIAYIKNVSIVEYDIKSAGFSVIKEKKLLDEQTIKKLEGMPKEKRNRQIGLYQKNNPELATAIVDTLKEVRMAFIIHNNIRPEEILAIKKDAIFLINKTPEYLLFGENFEFRAKSAFTSYMFLDELEIYYSSKTKEFIVKNFRSERNVCDYSTVRGEPVYGLEYGEKVEEFDPSNEQIFKDIKRFMALGEKLKPEAIFDLLRNYRSQYLNKELPKETYRIVTTGLYSYKDKHVKFINQEMMRDVNISDNYIRYIIPVIGNMI